MLAQEQLQVDRVGKFRRPAEPAVATVKGARQLFEALVNRTGVELCPRAGRLAGLGLLQGLDEGRVLLSQGGPFFLVNLVNPGQQGLETGQTVARFRREIGAAEERRPVFGHQEHGQGPAAGTPRQQLLRGLVDLVEIGPLLPVYLDIDEIAVHQVRSFLILKRLMRHDVTPVTGRITDRQQYRLPLSPGKPQRLITPRMPGNRIIGVLQ